MYLNLGCIAVTAQIFYVLGHRGHTETGDLYCNDALENKLEMRMFLKQIKWTFYA